MKSYKFLYLIWLIPATFLFLCIHQAMVWYGIIETYENGESYTAEVVEFEFKQIAAQTNGYIVLRFETSRGDNIQKKLSLPVEMAGQLQQIRVVPVRYQPGAFQEIVLMPTYGTQKGLVLTNLAMAVVALLMTLILAVVVHRYAHKKLRSGTEELEIERIDHSV
ncbi:hypothetical protein [Fodinibius sediminis]|uniref:Uncharacterized protein n=1 Tax=Fodinibius sediminis TaxID=1214077 RepID=A0A521CB33_9BACT|nr:hypothetical protein [Fodinibius sediminis]SMO56672.1 hypothetical protein SAMN06265218_105219 [Fodinibius sediminis]